MVRNLGAAMQQSIRTISSSDAKANLGDVLSSLNTHGPIEITRNGKSVGLLSLPPVQTVDRSRIAALAIAYSKGLISWPQIAEETGASYGDLLVELGLKNLQIPKVTPKNRPEKIAFFHHILDVAAAKSIGE
jgi:prevent-host-death family protein